MPIQRPQPTHPIPPDAEKVFEGLLFDVYHYDQILFDGTKEKYERLRSKNDGVVVLPILEDGRILLVEEEQSGAGKWLSLPAGKIDKGEDPEAAAKRELLEETGYASDNWRLWQAVQVSEKIDWASYFFIASGCKQVAEPATEAGEKITAKPVTFDEFLLEASREDFRIWEIGRTALRARLDKQDYTKLYDDLYGAQPS